MSWDAANANHFLSFIARLPLLLPLQSHCPTTNNTRRPLAIFSTTLNLLLVYNIISNQHNTLNLSLNRDIVRLHFSQLSPIMLHCSASCESNSLPPFHNALPPLVKYNTTSPTSHQHIHKHIPIHKRKRPLKSLVSSSHKSPSRVHSNTHTHPSSSSLQTMSSTQQACEQHYP